MNAYHHTQRAPLCWLLYFLGCVFLGVAWLCRHEPPFPYIFSPAAVVIFVVAAAFHHLTVADEGDRLAIRFGPLPLFQRRVPYSEIESVSLGQTTLVEGWGIHLSPRGGWVWNLWGWNCVVLKLRRGTLRIGTDDAENLARFLSSKLAPTPTV